MNPIFEAFELAAQYRRLAELLAERHDDEQVVADTLESISEPLDDRSTDLDRDRAGADNEQFIAGLAAAEDHVTGIVVAPLAAEAAQDPEVDTRGLHDRLHRLARQRAVAAAPSQSPDRNCANPI